MTARVLTPILLAAAAFRLAAQVVVADDIVTSDVNLFDVVAESEYNITAAMGMSLAVPGIGHYYIEKPVSAFAYMAIDAASIFGAIFFNTLANSRENEARSYAVAAAGIERAPSGAAYWRHVGRFMDAAEYNEAVELSRGETRDLYVNPAEWWRWGDESQQAEYNDMRQKARDMRVASSFFIGALVANRVVSVVDLYVFQRKKLTRSIRFETAVTPDMSGASVAMKTEF